MLPKLLAYLHNPRPTNSLYTLDGLRALAILWVVLLHGTLFFNSVMTPGTPVPPLLKALEPLTLNGWMGVNLFFVLSGFFITGQLLKFYETQQPFREIWRFYANRFLRIVPAFYALLLLLQFVFSRLPGFLSVITPENVAAYIPYYYLFLQDYQGIEMFSVVWSLGVEEKFYLLAPFVFLIPFSWLKQHWSRLLFIGLLLLVPLYARYHYTETTPWIQTTNIYQLFRFSHFHLRIDGLIVGAFCAYLFRHFAQHPWLQRPEVPKALLGLGILTILLLAFTLPMAPPYGQGVMVFSETAIALGFGLMVLGGALTPNPQAGLWGSRPLFFLARISYSLFLTHVLWLQPVLEFCGRTFHPLNSWPIPLQIILFYTYYCLVYFLFSTLVATVFFYVIEKPFLLLKERLQQKERHDESALDYSHAA